MQLEKVATSFTAEDRTEFRTGRATVEQVNRVTECFVVEHPKGEGIVGFMRWHNGPELQTFPDKQSLRIDLQNPTQAISEVTSLPVAKTKESVVVQNVLGKQTNLKVQSTVDRCARIDLQPMMPILMDEGYEFGGNRILMVTVSMPGSDFIVINPFATPASTDLLDTTGWVQPELQTASYDEIVSKVLSHATYITGIQEAL